MLSFSLFTPVLAQNNKDANYDFAKDAGLNKTSEAAGYDTNGKTVNSYISQIITIVLSMIGVVFLGFTIYAGITWMTAQGNEEKVSRAKEMITESIIGIIIVLAAYAISYFVLKATTGSLIQ